MDTNNITTGLSAEGKHRCRTITHNGNAKTTEETEICEMEKRGQNGQLETGISNIS